MANHANCLIRIPRNSIFERVGLVRLVPKDTPVDVIAEQQFTHKNEAGEVTKYKLIYSTEKEFNPDCVEKAYIENQDKESALLWKAISAAELPTKPCEWNKDHIRLDLDCDWGTPCIYHQQDYAFETMSITQDDENATREQINADSQVMVVLDGAKIASLARKSGAWAGVLYPTGASIGTQYIDIEFTAKWGFPNMIEEAFDSVAFSLEETQPWQGAVAEPGMAVYGNDIGTTDLGLDITYVAVCKECATTVDEPLAYRDPKNAEKQTCPECGGKCWAEGWTTAMANENGVELEFYEDEQQRVKKSNLTKQAE